MVLASMNGRWPALIAAGAAVLAAPRIPYSLTLHEAQSVMFRENPDLATLRLETENAESQWREARATWLPSLDALGSYAYTTEVSRLKFELPFPAPGGT